MTDAIPMLESDELLFSSKDSFELLRCTEDHGGDAKFQDKIEIFRLAVARNLARALTIEGCQNND